MNKLLILINLAILLIPKIIRNQYSELYYRIEYLLKKVKVKVKLFRKKIYILVPGIEDLKSKHELIFLEENRTSLVSAPLLENKYGIKHKDAMEALMPDIKVYLFENISILGGTDALIKDKHFYHYELLQMGRHHDLKAHDIFEKKDNISLDISSISVRDKLNIQNKYFILDKSSVQLEDDTIYITLLKEHSINYYHWVTEALPRLIVVLDAIKKNGFSLDKYTILVDHNVPRQLIETIGILAGDTMKIQMINRACAAHCKKLLYCSPLWLSLDNTTSIPNPKKEFFLDKNALNLVRENIKSKINILDTTNRSRKIYLKRDNNKLRPLTNLNALEEMLERLDFEFMDIGDLSFKEQVELFSEIKIVIGISGAAFTNILFMSPNTHVVSLYPSARSTNYYVFQPLADCAKVNLIHFLTKAKDINGSVHDKASVNIKRLEVKIKTMLGEDKDDYV